MKVYLLKCLVKTAVDETMMLHNKEFEPTARYPVSNYWELFKEYVDHNRWVVKQIDNKYPS